METTSADFLQSFWGGFLFGLVELFVALGVSWVSLRDWNLPFAISVLIPPTGMSLTILLTQNTHPVFGALVILALLLCSISLALGAWRRKRQGKPIWNWTEVRQRH